MKTTLDKFFITAFLVFLMNVNTNALPDELKLSISGLPAWKKDFLKNVDFTAKILPLKRIIPEIQTNEQNFIILSCAPKEKISRRILFADIKITFKHDTHIFIKGISYNITGNEIGVDIRKINVNNLSDIKKIEIITLAIK